MIEQPERTKFDKYNLGEKYDKNEAHGEALELKEKMESGKASNYKEANRIVNAEMMNEHFRSLEVMRSLPNAKELLQITWSLATTRDTLEYIALFKKNLSGELLSASRKIRILSNITKKKMGLSPSIKLDPDTDSENRFEIDDDKMRHLTNSMFFELKDLLNLNLVKEDDSYFEGIREVIDQIRPLFVSQGWIL